MAEEEVKGMVRPPKKHKLSVSESPKLRTHGPLFQRSTVRVVTSRAAHKSPLEIPVRETKMNTATSPQPESLTAFWTTSPSSVRFRRIFPIRTLSLWGIIVGLVLNISSSVINMCYKVERNLFPNWRSSVCGWRALVCRRFHP